MTVRVQIVGLEALRRKLEVTAPLVARAAMSAALYQEGHAILNESQQEVPVDLGTLRGSGHVTAPAAQGADIMVEIGYGGAASDYAVVQHEHLEFNHPHGGKAKYLEDPALRAASGMAARMALAVEAALRAGL